MTDVGAKLRRLSQGNSIEDGRQGVGVGRARGQETVPQAMEVDQSDGRQHVGTTKEQETGPQAIEANQNEIQVSGVSPFSLVRT